MHLAKLIFAEAIGTFLLIFTIGIAEGDPFAVGGIIFCVMIITQFVSGALLNPAVTLTVLLKKHLTKTLKKRDMKAYFYYTIAQFAAGFIAAYAAWQMGHYTKFYDFSSSYHPFRAIIAEAIQLKYL